MFLLATLVYLSLCVAIRIPSGVELEKQQLEILPVLFSSDFSPFSPIASAIYRCPYCPKSFKTNQLLKQHLNLHSRKSLFCEVCGAAFRWRSSKWCHMRKYHPNHRKNSTSLLDALPGHSTS